MCNECGCGEPSAPPGGYRLLRPELDLMAQNDRLAAQNRERLQKSGIQAINLVSSPGSGKTTLLVETLRRLQGRRPLAVIEGDQQTELDAERIRATGVPAEQIQTGAACHLDAHMVGHALERLPLSDGGLLFIENVGNLICPAGFDLGEQERVVLVSVTEGDDKPLKYPHIFRHASLLLITKLDLLPYVAFDPGRCLAAARQQNPHLPAIRLSAQSGEGLADWLAWLEARPCA